MQFLTPLFKAMTIPLPLGVVPIFANATAALLPAILAGFSTVLAVLMRPRELLRLLRRKPHIPVIAILLVAAAWIVIARIGAPSDPTPERRDRQEKATDWVKVALEIQRRRDRGGAVATPVVAVTRPAVPIIFRTGPTRTGHDGGPVPLDLGLEWEHNDGESMFLSSPAVSGDAVIAAACLLDIDSTYGGVICLDAGTGLPRWHLETYFADGQEVDTKGFFSSPAITADGTRILIGQGLHADSNCDLLCIDAGTGDLVWRLPTSLHLESSPAIEGDLVVIGAGAIEAGSDHQPTGDPGFVLAASISKGVELWRHAIADPESSPVIADGIAYIGSGFNGNAIVALRVDTDESLAASGLARELWRVSTEFPMTGGISLAGDLVIAGGGNGDYVYAAPEPAGEVIALSRTDGEIVWRRQGLEDAVLGSVAVSLERQEVVCGLRNGRVTVLSLETGEPRWSKVISRTAGVLAAPAIAGNSIFVVTSDGTLFTLDAGSGQKVESHYLNDEARPGELKLSLSSPTISAGRLYVGSETGGIRCYTAARFE